MNEPAGWPVRYKVTIESQKGGRANFSVVTLLGEHKAIGLAVLTYVRRGLLDGSVRDVTVAKSNQVERDERGLPRFDPNDITDRMEW